MMMMIHFVSKSAIFTHRRLVLRQVELDVFNRMAQRASATVADGHGAFDLNRGDLVDELLSVGMVRVASLAGGLLEQLLLQLLTLVTC